jgi:hypothetical protein
VGILFLLKDDSRKMPATSTLAYSPKNWAAFSAPGTWLISSKNMRNQVVKPICMLCDCNSGDSLPQRATHNQQEAFLHEGEGTVYLQKNSHSKQVECKRILFCAAWLCTGTVFWQACPEDAASVGILHKTQIRTGGRCVWVHSQCNPHDTLTTYFVAV